MPYFKWVAIDIDGAIHKGSAKMLSEKALLQDLIAKDLGLIKALRVNKCRFFNRITLLHYREFFFSLSLLLKAGLPIDKAFKYIALQQTHRYFKEYIHEIGVSIEQGKSLSHALHEYPEVFNHIMCMAISAGHEAGAVIKSLEIVVEYLDMLQEFNIKIKAALTMPCIILTVFIAVCIFIIGFIAPTLVQAFSSLSTPIPYSLQLILGIADLFSLKNGLIFLSSLLFFIYGLKWLRHKKAFCIDYECILFSMPLIKGLLKEYICLYWLSSLSVLLQSGRSLHASLETIGLTDYFLHSRKIIKNIADNVAQGIPLYHLCEKYPSWFKPEINALLALGYESGDLALMVGRAALLQKLAVQKKLLRISILMQPLLIIVLGGLVCLLIVGIYYPLIMGALHIQGM
jgi:type II secretory pathway component PulF